METTFLNGVWIGFVTGSFFTCIILVKMYRRHWQNITTIELAAHDLKMLKDQYQKASIDAMNSAKHLEKSREEFQKLINRIYHRDWFPDLCRAEGLIDLATRENHHEYAKLALQQIKTLKNRLQQIIEQYNLYQ
jgi:hypothetical protein